MFLESLGADDSVFASFRPYASDGLVLARVAVSQHDHCQLLTEQGEIAGEPSGALCYRAADLADMPVTGDWVAARVVDSSLAIVEAVLTRKTVLSRTAAGRSARQQPVAANIDLVFLVCGLDGDYNLRRLERYLTLTMEAGAEAIVVLNKSDLCQDVEKRINETAAVARGAPIVATTTLVPGGVDELRRFLAFGRTVALLGSSGVGKSAIINRLLGQQRQRTHEVRASDSRGRHTTARRELIPLGGGGALIDTPGMRELRLWAGEDSVLQAFDDIAELAAGCRFRDCSHTGEMGCAVGRAVAGGYLAEGRLKNYFKLRAEAKRHEELSNRLAAVHRKRSAKAMERRIRAFHREADRD